LKRKEQKMDNMSKYIARRDPTYPIICGFISVALLVTIACSIVPFYAFGLHQQPINLVVGGNFDPKNMSFYQTLPGSLIYFIGIIMFIALPIILTGFVPLMLIALIRDRHKLSLSWQAYGAALTVTSVILVMFMYAGMGRLILTWFMD
jgi:hypothetical protein